MDAVLCGQRRSCCGFFFFCFKDQDFIKGWLQRQQNKRRQCLMSWWWWAAFLIWILTIFNINIYFSKGNFSSLIELKIILVILLVTGSRAIGPRWSGRARTQIATFSPESNALIKPLTNRVTESSWLLLSLQFWLYVKKTKGKFIINF